MTMKQSLLSISLAALAAAIWMAPTPIGAQSQNRPDFSGIWGGGIAQLTPTTCKQKVDAFPQDSERFSAGGAKGGLKWITFEQDCSIQNRGRVNKPLYKPQYWEKGSKRARAGIAVDCPHPPGNEAAKTPE